MKIFQSIVFAFSMVLLLTACSPQSATSTTPADTATAVNPANGLLTNAADEQTQAWLQQALAKHLSDDSVQTVMGWITDYNTTIHGTTLTQGFVQSAPEYDVAAMDKLWGDAKGDFIGTNCRINTFTLLKDIIKINPKPDTDGALLFMDHEAIETGKLLSADDAAKFDRLFARVPTAATKDAQVHAEKMRAHFDGIGFDDNVTMLSVVFHDDLDSGDHLFIGHVGVLLPADDGFLFIEKISFQEPYQIFKFATKDDAYTYLFNKYAVDYEQPTAEPFIMENDRLVKWRTDK